MEAAERISPSIINRLKEAIDDANGNEIFAVGSIGDEYKVFEIKVTARGNYGSVPVINSYVEKGDVVIHNHPSGNLSPSYADMGVASRLGDQGIGFFIIDNEVNNVYVVAEPVLKKDTVYLDATKLEKILLPGGALNSISDTYEERPSQVRMLRLVCNVLCDDGICIAEAGTGVGKSLAYLIPVIEWLYNNEERIIVSTATINLQQQLIEKDIPLVKKLLKHNIKSVLVKGRGNYICLSRLNDTLNEFSVFEELNEELNNLSEWALSSKTGSKSDIVPFPSKEVWARVCSEADLCVGLYCKYREDCFVLKARREAASAKLLVVNHHLLFSDLSVRLSGIGYESAAVLPPFNRIIFDEAHNIEACATSFFSLSFTRFSLTRHLNRFYRKKKGHVFGFLLAFKKKLKNKDKINKIPDIIEEIKEKAKILDLNSLSALEGRSALRIEEINVSEIETPILNDLFELGGMILKLCGDLGEIIDRFEDIENENSLLFESRAHLKKLMRIVEICEQFKRIEEDKENIFWIERLRTSFSESFIRFVITPLLIAPMMKEAVFEPYKSIIFTSATITVTGSFYYWKSRIGLIQEEVVEQKFESPFNYKENVLLGIPIDSPLPDQNGFQDFISSFIKDVIKISGGRALVLFTSYSMLNSTYKDVLPHLEEMGIYVFKQGDDDRSRLLAGFKKDIGSVLFATDSFWEGVDTPGKALEILILCRLPFKVPTDPVINARMEDIRDKGGNPFIELSLPEAVIKLKQGYEEG